MAAAALMGGGQGSGDAPAFGFDGVDWGHARRQVGGWAETAGGRCRAFAADPRGRICVLFTAAIATVAITIATPWLPHSPWNKPASR